MVERKLIVSYLSGCLEVQSESVAGFEGAFIQKQNIRRVAGAEGSEALKHYIINVVIDRIDFNLAGNDRPTAALINFTASLQDQIGQLHQLIESAISDRGLREWNEMVGHTGRA